MDEITMHEIQVSSPAIVSRYAHEFAEALAATQQFRAFEAAAEIFEHDQAAQAAYHAFQVKQKEISLMKKLNAVSPEEQAKFDLLRDAFQKQPSVRAYFEAQDNLISVCQAAGDIISKATGLDFAKSASPSGCC